MTGPSRLCLPSNFILGCDPLCSFERWGVTPHSKIAEKKWSMKIINPFKDFALLVFFRSRSLNKVCSYFSSCCSIRTHLAFLSFFLENILHNLHGPRCDGVGLEVELAAKRTHTNDVQISAFPEGAVLSSMACQRRGGDYLLNKSTCMAPP